MTLFVPPIQGCVFGRLLIVRQTNSIKSLPKHTNKTTKTLKAVWPSAAGHCSMRIQIVDIKKHNSYLQLLCREIIAYIFFSLFFSVFQQTYTKVWFASYSGSYKVVGPRKYIRWTLQNKKYGSPEPNNFQKIFCAHIGNYTHFL